MLPLKNLPCLTLIALALGLPATPAAHAGGLLIAQQSAASEEVEVEPVDDTGVEDAELDALLDVEIGRASCRGRV